MNRRRLRNTVRHEIAETADSTAAIASQFLPANSFERRIPTDSLDKPGGTASASRLHPVLVMKYQNLRDRTFAFALATIQFCRKLPSTWEAQHIRGQLFDSGTSVGANYRAAGRARSDSEFIARLGVVVEEADESDFWLALLKASGIDDSAGRNELADEAGELRAIFVTSRKTAIANAKRKQAAKQAKARIPSTRET